MIEKLLNSVLPKHRDLSVARRSIICLCLCPWADQNLSHMWYTRSFFASVPSPRFKYTAISIKVVPKKREKVEYERERLIGKD